MSQQEKAEFENTGAGVVGVTTIEPGTGKHRSIAVRPHETVWLSEEEQVVTANAPKRDADNPFTNGSLTLKTEPKQIANRRPIGHSETAQVPQSDEQKAAAAEKRAEQQAEREKSKQADAEAEDARKARIAERQQEAEDQAKAGVKPVKGTQVEKSASGTPKPARAAQGGGGAPAKGAGVTA